jgi:hypothetical protein
LTTDGSGLGVGVPGSGCSGFAAATHRRPPFKAASPSRRAAAWWSSSAGGFGLLHGRPPNPSPSPFLFSFHSPSYLPISGGGRGGLGKIPHGRRRSGKGRRSGFIGRRPRVPGLESGRRGCGVGARGGHLRLPTLQGGGGHGAGAALASPPLPPRHASPVRARDGRKVGKGS